MGDAQCVSLEMKSFWKLLILSIPKGNYLYSLFKYLQRIELTFQALVETSFRRTSRLQQSLQQHVIEENDQLLEYGRESLQRHFRNPRGYS